MKRILISILVSMAILSTIFSCATTPKAPLEEGELRLLSVDVPDGGNIKMNIERWITINFEANGRPEIRRVCMTWSGDGPYCMPVKKIKYGSEANFEVPIHARPDMNRLECYVEYVRDGKMRRTNTVSVYVMGTM